MASNAMLLDAAIQALKLEVKQSERKAKRAYENGRQAAFNDVLNWMEAAINNAGTEQAAYMLHSVNGQLLQAMGELDS